MCALFSGDKLITDNICGGTCRILPRSFLIEPLMCRFAHNAISMPDNSQATESSPSRCMKRSVLAGDNSSKVSDDPSLVSLSASYHFHPMNWFLVSLRRHFRRSAADTRPLNSPCSSGAMQRDRTACRSRVDHLVPLLLPLQPLDSLLVHLGLQLLIPFLLFLLRSLLLDRCYPLLSHLSVLHSHRPPCNRIGGRTWRSASFSSFISFSFALIRARSSRSFCFCLNDFRPAAGRNAFFGACHCLPAHASLADGLRAAGV